MERQKQIRLGLAILASLLVVSALIGLLSGRGKPDNTPAEPELAVATSPATPNPPSQAPIPATPGATDPASGQSQPTPSPAFRAASPAAPGSNLSPAPAAVPNPTFAENPVVPPARSPWPIAGSSPPPAQANGVFIVGTITTYDKPAGLLQLAQADGSNIAVKIGTSTTISRSGRVAAATDIKPGELVAASGSYNNQGQLVATELRLSPNGSARDPVSNPPRLPPAPTQPK